MDKQSFARLYQKYLSGIATPEELETFRGYLAMPEAEEVLRDLLRETYDGIRKHSATLVDADGNLVPAPETFALPRHLPAKRRWRFMRNAGLAAGSALVLAFLVWFTWEKRAEPAGGARLVTRSASTTRSEYKRLVLPDSSVVWLNAGSRLDFPDHFGKDDREVSLSGEAYFDIKHIAGHSFLIHTGRISTKVLGTAFNIKAYPGVAMITVSVSRGRVQVIRGNETLATLVRGQQVRVPGGDSAHALRKNIVPAEVADWQNGNLAYDDQSLAEVVADLGRVFDADIRIRNAKLAEIKISTRVRRSEGLPQALDILSKLTESKVILSNNVYSFQ